MPQKDYADVHKDIEGLHAPEPSCLPLIGDYGQKIGKSSASKEDDVMSSESREVLDHMVRLEFDIVQEHEDPNAANIFSFYGNYYDYLDEYNLIEVSYKFSDKLSLALASEAS